MWFLRGRYQGSLAINRVNIISLIQINLISDIKKNRSGEKERLGNFILYGELIRIFQHDFYSVFFGIQPEGLYIAFVRNIGGY